MSAIKEADVVLKSYRFNLSENSAQSLPAQAVRSRTGFPRKALTKLVGYPQGLADALGGLTAKVSGCS